MQLTARQATLLHGWLWTKPTLTWKDIVSRKLTFQQLVNVGISIREMVTMQADPAEWVRHAQAGQRHLRLMIEWPANPFQHFGMDLADLLAMRLSVDELVRMDVTYEQLKKNGLNPRMELMFKFSPEEWDVLGRPEGVEKGQLIKWT